MLIKIDDRGVKQEIEAYIRGAFAVHAPSAASLKSRKPDAYYTVTHVKTGYAACLVWGRARALRLAQRLNRLLPEGDFTAEDFETEKYLTFVQQAHPVIKRAREAGERDREVAVHG